jgi:hypothetical protein
VHRWDLTERADNPRLSLKLGGRANLAARTLDAAEVALVSPTSNLHGTLHFAEGVPAVQVKSAGIQATDLLAWWRAFEPGVDDGIAVDQYFTGVAGVHGWPPSVDELTFSSDGGSIKIPGIAEPVWVGAVRGGGAGEKLAMEPVRVRLGGEGNAVVGAGKRRSALPLRDAGDLTASEDFTAHEGGLAIDGEVEQIAALLRAAAAMGHGWARRGIYAMGLEPAEGAAVERENRAIESASGGGGIKSATASGKCRVRLGERTTERISWRGRRVRYELVGHASRKSFRGR